MPRTVRRSALGGAARALLALALLVPAAGRASLDEPGFRAVGVAHAFDPISALALAPDGRLFAAVQATDQSTGTPASPVQAQIRVYQAYATADGSVLDEGTLWATVDGVRATSLAEGLLGIALAPDFATSKLVYVYLTTTDENQNEHVRVYRENANGTGDYLGAVATSLEPPNEQSSHNGGGLAFGPDACLYAGIGDDGPSWNAQLPLGTDAVGGTEQANLCTNVCLGPAELPDRTVKNNGAPNEAGKVLRFAVDGASPAQPGPANPLAKQADIFAAGFRDPVAFAVHPLTGQLYVAERGNSQQSEIDVVDSGSNGGWPCLEGSVLGTAGVSCLSGKQPSDVYANHPAWRRPIVTLPPTPSLNVSGLAAYTGLGYPADYYGNLFYLLRDSARIYRVALAPPCFLPHPNGVTPLKFHDSGNDGDFQVLYELDGNPKDGPETLTTTNLTAIVQAPNPLGQQVLYVAGRENNGVPSSTNRNHGVLFRIEYATEFTPYAGPAGRVDDSCFANGVYSGFQVDPGTPLYAWENPFQRAPCALPGAGCTGAPDGTPCDDGNACNGTESCLAGVCRHGSPPPEGSACPAADQCHAAGTCHDFACVGGPALPDGTPCPDDDPCNGLETCRAGVCTAGSGPETLAVRSLRIRRKGATLALHGSIHPSAAIAPASTDALSLTLLDAGGVVFSGTLAHPASNRHWHARRGRATYADRRGSASGLTSVVLRPEHGGVFAVDVLGRGVPLGGLTQPAVSSRLVIGKQCFAADLGGACTLDPRKLRCGGP
ncbi:MAG TPA: PQQ-dependent sugar dehydrogenase [Candidatus Binatia bacterium]|nr:PQQ-dependent sugar dehydrogenase [Candidatus Binatia bacterium]